MNGKNKISYNQFVMKLCFSFLFSICLFYGNTALAEVNYTMCAKYFKPYGTIFYNMPPNIVLTETGELKRDEKSDHPLQDFTHKKAVRDDGTISSESISYTAELKIPNRDVQVKYHLYLLNDKAGNLKRITYSREYPKSWLEREKGRMYPISNLATSSTQDKIEEIKTARWVVAKKYRWVLTSVDFEVRNGQYCVPVRSVSKFLIHPGSNKHQEVLDFDLNLCQQAANFWQRNMTEINAVWFGDISQGIQRIFGSYTQQNNLSQKKNKKEKTYKDYLKVVTDIGINEIVSYYNTEKFPSNFVFQMLMEKCDSEGYSDVFARFLRAPGLSSNLNDEAFSQ